MILSDQTIKDLIQTEDLRQFFILDSDLVSEEEEFFPSCDVSDIFPFKFMGKAESNAINLAIASGLLSKALDLECALVYLDHDL